MLIQFQQNLQELFGYPLKRYLNKIYLFNLTKNMKQKSEYLFRL